MKIDIIKEYGVKGVGHLIEVSNEEYLTGKNIVLRTIPYLLLEKFKNRTYKLIDFENQYIYNNVSKILIPLTEQENKGLKNGNKNKNKR